MHEMMSHGKKTGPDYYHPIFLVAEAVVVVADVVDDDDDKILCFFVLSSLRVSPSSFPLYS